VLGHREAETTIGGQARDTGAGALADIYPTFAATLNKVKAGR
jgi:hypothetical protein